MKFTELHLAEDILSAVAKVGFVEPSPIQELTIPLALEGKDVIGQAQTGTGKTAAFGLPTLNKIDVTNNVVQALVIAPTRELAVQSQEELFRFGREKKVKVRSVYGGSSIEKQIKALKSGAHIVVGTPGRLLDLIKRKALKLNHVETLILDEADEMLNMGFLEDIEAIISRVPETRQTLLFSATMPDAIKRIGVKFMKEPEHVKIAAKELTTDLVDQYYIRVKENEKFDTMTRLMDVEQPELSIVFGRTKRRVDELTRGLKLRGYRAEGIHGDLDQGKRLRVLRDFKMITLTFWSRQMWRLVVSIFRASLMFITMIFRKTLKVMFIALVVQVVLVSTVSQSLLWLPMKWAIFKLLKSSLKNA